ncbi:MAG: 16S rRNA (adenine(1518)-N(6)/adenine(1519)-N(6))-dimethyltransferase RsmA [Oscillospiraceae bacterium]|jgi:16S rRNA (adenine1518-N6/adenine1519-N6)-dimethyltransferase|nr:16S rRNA (adenine(1518)-N(6)/adenine(1519)-N(6))-dimethyltransferase RsmA [Oscillospiraceae bacterium]
MAINEMKRGMFPKKSLGQNFLVNKGVARKIAECSLAPNCSAVLEIGPGLGALTLELARVFKKVVAVELDSGLIEPLLANLNAAAVSNVTVINGDILKVDLESLFAKEFAGMGVVCASNLPYYITSCVLVRLLESNLGLMAITVMTQKEMAFRLCAELKTKGLGAISFCVRYYSVPKLLFLVSPGSFRPVPKIESAVVRFEMLIEPSVGTVDKQFMFDLIRAGFGQRRKMLLNSLSHSMGLDKRKLEIVFAELGINRLSRPEQLDLVDFAGLADKLLGDFEGKEGAGL